MAAAPVTEIRKSVTNRNPTIILAIGHFDTFWKGPTPIIYQSPQALHVETVKFESHAEAFPMDKERPLYEYTP